MISNFSLAPGFFRPLHKSSIIRPLHSFFCCCFLLIISARLLRFARDLRAFSLFIAPQPTSEKFHFESRPEETKTSAALIKTTKESDPRGCKWNVHRTGLGLKDSERFILPLDAEILKINLFLIVKPYEEGKKSIHGSGFNFLIYIKYCVIIPT